jgi:hypothetical protein
MKRYDKPLKRESNGLLHRESPALVTHLVHLEGGQVELDEGELKVCYHIFRQSFGLRSRRWE